MRSLSARHVLVLFLAVLFGLGTVLSDVQAAVQKTVIAAAADFGASGSTGCDGCNGGGDGSGCGVCITTCGTACLSGLLPQGISLFKGVTFRHLDHPSKARQRWASPDPFPPKHLIIA